MIERRQFLRRAAWALAGALAAPSCTPRIRPASASASASTSASGATAPRAAAFLEEITIDALGAGMAEGRFTARSLVQAYLRRVEQIDGMGPELRSVLEINPDALTIAEAMDKERRAQGPRGPMHGIPVLIKDNIATRDRMETTAGSLALIGAKPREEAFLVRRLREAGAVLLGKTNLSEWANFRGNRSISGWSARGGQTRNPYALDRNPSGSSSGSAVAVAANLCAAAVGTETDGSILSPSSFNGIVGLKPTVGLISRSGIIPISHTQDTAGPMARTVRDAAILLDTLAGPDPADPATNGPGRAATPYANLLDPDALRGARVGVARQLFTSNRGANECANDAIAAMQAAGAEIIDPAEIPSHGKLGREEYEVMLYEFKAGLNAYLAALGPEAPVRSLEDLIAFNERMKDRELIWFGQEHLERAQTKGPLTEKDYLEALERCGRLARAEGIDAAMDQHRLDALLAPTTGPAHVTDWVYGDRGAGASTTWAAVAGYPSITVPAGHVAGLPVGISIFGRAWSETRILQLAYAYEQITRHRRPPAFAPSLENAMEGG